MPSNIVRLASVRLITTDIARSVRFWEVVTGVTPNYITEDFVELVTPSATVAVSDVGRVPFVSEPSGDVSDSAIVEFWVDDAEALFAELQAAYGDDLDVVQAPTVMPWGNMSIVIRDPNGVLVNLYTPVTPDAWKLQRNRTP